MKKDNKEIATQEIIKILREAEDYLDGLARKIGEERDKYQVPYMISIIKDEITKGKLKKINTAWIQRKFKIGYARSARLIDSLEKQGIVGPAEGAEPRMILKRGKK